MQKIKELLDKNKIEYEIKEHEPVYTSEQAAKVRGSKLKEGVKALVLKSNTGKFILALIAADKKVDLKKLAKVTNNKELKLAKAEEVLKETNCEVGSVPPFGSVLGLQTYMDKSVAENDFVEFNAGLLTSSIRMKAKDLVAVVKPLIVETSLD